MTKKKVTSSAEGSSVTKLALWDDETTSGLDWFNPCVDGEIKGHGYVPRNYRTHPPQMFDPPSELKVYPRSEWSDRIKQKTQEKSWLTDLRTWPSLDQNGNGFCWAYSTTSCVMLNRSLMNQPYVRLSAHAVACKIKNFRDEGGWCGLSAKFQREQGCPSVEFWAEKSMSRSHDRPETWANAALHKVSEEWVDLTRDVWDQNLSFDIVATCLLNNVPVAVDFNHWSHSVCGIELVEVEPGSFGLKILNSWTDGWGERGTGILRGSKAIPDGAVAIRVAGASLL